MPKFSFTAIDATGASIEGVEKGSSIDHVRTALVEQGLHPITIKEKPSLLKMEVTKQKLKRKDLMHFSRQLAVFIRAGIPILDALETVAEEASSKVLHKVLDGMAEHLRAGGTFADAASMYPEAFPPFYLGILRSAELTGNLDSTLDQLADYLDRDLEAKTKVVSALVYPAMTLGMSIVTVLILVIYVLPKFSTFFGDLHAKLPLTTRSLLAISGFAQAYWYLAVFGLVGLVAAVVLGNKTDGGRKIRDRVLLHIPGFGKIVKGSILERFCRILSSMIGAGVPLPEALAVTTEATNNTLYKQRLTTARDAMMQGDGLARPLAETQLFPGAARQMFRVGEETGTLDKQLAVAATYFDRELDMRIKRFTSLFEPMVIIFMGVMVGFVALALVQAMYGVLGAVQG
jgi:type IV pilus assembly protein PilC